MKKIILVAGWLLSLCCVPVQASFVYSYTGNLYNSVSSSGLFDTSMRVTGYFELETALAPNLVDATVVPDEFKFDDGANIVTHTNGGVIIENLTTNSVGALVSWSISAIRGYALPLASGSSLVDIASRNTSSDVLDQASVFELLCIGPCFSIPVGSAEVTGNPGEWTVSEVPLPAAGWLFVVGLAGLWTGAMRRRSGARKQGFVS